MYRLRLETRRHSLQAHRRFDFTGVDHAGLMFCLRILCVEASSVCESTVTSRSFRGGVVGNLRRKGATTSLPFRHFHASNAMAKRTTLFHDNSLGLSMLERISMVFQLLSDSALDVHSPLAGHCFFMFLSLG